MQSKKPTIRAAVFVDFFGVSVAKNNSSITSPSRVPLFSHRQPRPPLIRGSDAAGARSQTFVIPRDAVKGVEVVGGGAMAQDALRRVGGSDPRSARSADVFARERLAFRPFSAASPDAPFGRGAFPPRADPAAEQSSGAFLNTIRAMT